MVQVVGTSALTIPYVHHVHDVAQVNTSIKVEVHGVIDAKRGNIMAMWQKHRAKTAKVDNLKQNTRVIFVKNVCQEP